MQVLVGRAVSPGYAKGKAVLFDGRSTAEIPRYGIQGDDVNQELARFQDALARSCSELRQLEHRVMTELGATQSSIFSAHLGLLEDQQFIERVRRRIRNNLINVEQAVDAEVDDLTRLLASLENEYLRERSQDIRDVGSRVLRQLARGDDNPFLELPPHSVIVARELLPSETIDLDRRQVAAIVTEEGGENSHAAILARGLGIPAVTAVHRATSEIPEGSRLLVDGQTGRVTITPSDPATHKFAQSKVEYDDSLLAATKAENLACVTLDGFQVSLLANINRPHEAAMVAAHNLDGVGLFRTEFLFMDSHEPPSYERQLAAYRAVIETLDGRPLVIRTLDFGGDKIPAFLSTRSEILGLRGLRFSLAYGELLETQLRAILAATNGQDLRLQFPLVLGESDLRQGIELLQTIAAKQGLTRLPQIGAMIETPSALFSLDEILELVDFVSIGTNDLTQFMLAADRNAAELVDDYSVLHRSVLRAIRTVIERCVAAGREVCICGEAAGEPEAARLFVGFGVCQLSMSPLRAARVRQALRHSLHQELKQLAENAVSVARPWSDTQLFAGPP